MVFDQGRNAVQRSRSAKALGASVLATLLCLPAVALAEANPPSGFLAERMRVSVDRSGLVDTEWGGVPNHLSIDVGVWAGWAKNPLVLYRQSDGERAGALLNNRVGGAFMGSIGLFGFAQVGLEIPVVFYQDRPSSIPGVTTQGFASLKSLSLADIRFVPKVRVLRADKHKVDVSFIPSFFLPSGGGEAYAGEQGFTFIPELAISRAFGPWRVATNIGAYLRKSTQYLDQKIESELTARIAGGYRFAERGGPPVEVDLGISGATSALAPFKEANQNALELRGQVAYTTAKVVQVFGGAGVGLHHGFSTPDWRIFAGVRVGFWNDAPAAPTPPPPPPAEKKAEPPPPPADTDGDGILDKDDACPTQPENKNGVQDTDGCPEPDEDGDEVPDAEDNCPKEPGRREYHGCKEPQLAKIEQGNISIIEKVFFKTDKDVIESRSYAVLNNVAKVILAHPEVKKLQVEGHTDNEGSKKHNMELSQRRAEAVVRYLVSKGVEERRLVAKGFGPTKPIDTNDTKEGRANNRRVEFSALEMNSAGIQKNENKAGKETK